MIRLGKINLSIGQKLFAGFAACFVAVLALVTVAALSFRELEEARTANTRSLSQAQAATSLRMAIFRRSIAVRSYALEPNEQRLERLREAFANVVDELRALSEIVGDTHERSLIVTLYDHQRTYEATAQRFLQAEATIGTPDLMALENGLALIREEMVSALTELDRRIGKEVEERRNGAAAIQHNMMMTLPAGAALVLLIMALTAWLTARSVQAPALRLVHAARGVAKGDFSLALELEKHGSASARDEMTELSAAFAKMARALKERESDLQAQSAEIQAQNEELQSQNEELQSQGEEIQAQSEELQAQGDELRRLVHALEEADQRKDEFIALLSHELRNPLAPIQNSIAVLERSEPQSEYAGRARATITRQVHHMTRLVDDLLDVTRITRGKVELRKQPLELIELLRRVIEDHRPSFTARSVRVELELIESAWVEGDDTRLAQVFGNLLQNAAKFTPNEGVVEVRVTCDEGHVTVRVIDSGDGIDPAMLPRIFDAFVQGETALDRGNGGLGLGLALVRGLVELHGGTVSASSRGIGAGSEFVVRLPRAAKRLTDSRESHDVPTHRRRVLIIEDNVDAAMTLCDLLALEGHEAFVTHNGADGVAVAKERRPDLIFCDLGLPGMNGYAVAKALREDAALDETFLVALSGYARDRDKEASRAAGFDYHIAKPSNVATFRRVLLMRRVVTRQT